MRLMNRLALMVLILLPAWPAFAQDARNPSPDGVWRTASAPADGAARPAPVISATRYETFQLDAEALNSVLGEARPERNAAARDATITLTLPTPEGDYEAFELTESPVMAPGLAQWMQDKGYPMRTFSGRSHRNAGRTARLDWGGPAGFHAMVSAPGRTYYVDPAYRDNSSTYMSYAKRDFDPGDKRLDCGVEGEARAVNRAASGAIAARTSGLRVYRTAVAATGEYARFHDAASSAEAKVDAQAAIITTINRVNQIYERDLGLRLVLVGDNHKVVYTDPETDPYENGNGFQMVTENQKRVTEVIGSANFDLGHVFGLNSGGMANLAVSCKDFSKARGMTGSSNPLGDPFDVDYVAHEIGHQLGANHTFNAASGGSCTSSTRNASTAYEPGSGSTIMGYAGICSSNNLQGNSDDYFHGISLDEIHAHLSGTGSCYSTLASSNANPPSVDAGLNRVIPVNTPFQLSPARSSDADGDRLTYVWEEFDLGPAVDLAAGDNGSSPLFRSQAPSNSSTRTLPSLADLARGANPKGIKLPAASRTLNFRVTVRDNHSGGGLLAEDFMTVTATAAAGPFRVTAPNGGEGFNVAATPSIPVTWDPANTAAAPVSSDSVFIRLSVDGGLSYPRELLAGTPNDGSVSVALPPGISTDQARIMVGAADNIFFDVSDANFRISGAPANCSTPGKILPNGGSISDVLTLDEDRLIGDLNITLDADLNRIGDLVATLTHVDSGITAVLVDRPGVPGNPTGCLNGRMAATLDDEAAAAIETACTPGAAGNISGAFRPNNPLSAFDGQRAGGQWRLTLRDASNNQTPDITSVLNSWCVQGGEIESAPLSVSVAGPGSGRVSADSGGISCPGTCRADYIQGARVRLSAAPAAGSVFSGWSGACAGSGGACEVTLSAARNVAASFALADPDPDPAPNPLPGDGYCSSESVPLADSGTVANDIRVTASGRISDLDLALNITHSWVGDVGVTLQHLETGTSVVLLDRPGLAATPGPGENGCGNDNIGAVLDDEAGSHAEDTCNATAPALSGRLKPLNALSAFDGQNLAGTWRLRVSDSAPDDTGHLVQWCLQPTIAGSAGNPRLTVAVGGNGTGVVRTSAGGLACPGNCAVNYAQGAQVRLETETARGSVFQGWSGACSGAASACNVSMNADKTVNAAFRLLPAGTECSADTMRVASGYTSGAHNIYSQTAIETQGNVAVINTARVQFQAPVVKLKPGLRILNGGQLKIVPGRVACQDL